MAMSLSRKTLFRRASTGTEDDMMAVTQIRLILSSSKSFVLSCFGEVFYQRCINGGDENE
jgi:hypothetical protein